MTSVSYAIVNYSTKRFKKAIILVFYMSFIHYAIPFSLGNIAGISSLL